MTCFKTEQVKAVTVKEEAKWHTKYEIAVSAR